MRELKFRAWSPFENKFLYFDGIFNTRPTCNLTHWLPLGEVMQFTGLKDKNGKEIYEGDILHQVLFTDWVVAWKAPGFIVYNTSNFQRDYPLVESDREVIGNIHETPEPKQWA